MERKLLKQAVFWEYYFPFPSEEKSRENVSSQKVSLNQLDIHRGQLKLDSVNVKFCQLRKIWICLSHLSALKYFL